MNKRRRWKAKARRAGHTDARQGVIPLEFQGKMYHPQLGMMVDVWLVRLDAARQRKLALGRQTLNSPVRHYPYFAGHRPPTSR